MAAAGHEPVSRRAGVTGTIKVTPRLRHSNEGAQPLILYRFSAAVAAHTRKASLEH